MFYRKIFTFISTVIKSFYKSIKTKIKSFKEQSYFYKRAKIKVKLLNKLFGKNSNINKLALIIHPRFIIYLFPIITHFFTKYNSDFVLNHNNIQNFYLAILFTFSSLIILSSLFKHIFFNKKFSGIYQILIEFTTIIFWLYHGIIYMDQNFFPYPNNNNIIPYLHPAPILGSYFLQLLYVHFATIGIFCVCLFAIMLVISLGIYIEAVDITNTSTNAPHRSIIHIINKLTHTYINQTILFSVIISGLIVSTIYANHIYSIIYYDTVTLEQSLALSLYEKDLSYYRSLLTTLCLIPLFKIIRNGFTN